MYNKYFDLSFPEATKSLIKESFTKKLLESNASNKLFSLLSNIERLNSELEELKKQEIASRDRKNKENPHLAELWGKLFNLERRISDLQRTYTFDHYDREGNWEERTYDETKKAAVADAEAALKKELETVSAEYYKLKDEVDAAYKAEFDDHAQRIQAKNQALTNAKEDKKVAIAELLTEEKAELDKIISDLKTISKASITPDFANAFVAENKLYIPIDGESAEFEINLEDYDGDGFDADDYNFDTDGYIEKLKSDPEAWSDFNNFDPYSIQYYLELDDPVDGIIYFKNSTWGIDTDMDFEIKDTPEVHYSKFERGVINAPAEDCYPDEWDIDYDEVVEVFPTCYLVKILA